MFGRTKTETVTDERDTVGRHRTTDAAAAPVAPAEHHAVAQEVRREHFGGLNAGAAFFGWLVAIAVSVLLTGIIGAIAAAIGWNAHITQDQAQRQAGTIGLVAAIVLLVVLMIGYYAGGYVAGRMSRFSGAAQGLGVWVIGLLVTVLMLVLGAVFGEQYDVLNRMNLPRLPVSTGALGTTGVVAAIIVLAGTLLAALLGGSVGTHYHRRVDRAGMIPADAVV
jgi:hypothetical protein